MASFRSLPSFFLFLWINYKTVRVNWTFSIRPWRTYDASVLTITMTADFIREAFIMQIKVTSCSGHEVQEALSLWVLCTKCMVWRMHYGPVTFVCRAACFNSRTMRLKRTKFSKDVVSTTSKLHCLMFWDWQWQNGGWRKLRGGTHRWCILVSEVGTFETFFYSGIILLSYNHVQFREKVVWIRYSLIHVTVQSTCTTNQRSVQCDMPGYNYSLKQNISGGRHIVTFRCPRNYSHFPSYLWRYNTWKANST